MAHGASELSSARISWIRARLGFAAQMGAPPPRWPPSEAIETALCRDGLAQALELEDDSSSSYVIEQQLRPESPHLWLARDRQLDREVVLKLEREDNPDSLSALAWEGALVARLRHPHIITILEAGLGQGYLVFERLDSDLRALIGCPSQLMLDALSQAGRGLAAMHAQGICHGDVKAENILVYVARDADDVITRLWAKVGDLGSAHMAGEIQEGQRAGCLWMDTLAFTATAWECLTGGLRPPAGQELIPSELHALLDRNLMPNAGQRWADITALVDAMERARGATAATQAHFADGPSRPRALDEALALAEDGQFATATFRWRELRDRGGEAAELGRSAFRLGAALLTASRRASGMSRQLGFARCVDVLDDAARSFERADDREGVAEVRTVLADACAEWMQTYPPASEEHLQLAELTHELRRVDQPEEND